MYESSFELIPHTRFIAPYDSFKAEKIGKCLREGYVVRMQFTFQFVNECHKNALVADELIMK